MSCHETVVDMKTVVFCHTTDWFDRKHEYIFLQQALWTLDGITSRVSLGSSPVNVLTHSTSKTQYDLMSKSSTVNQGFSVRVRWKVLNAHL